MIRNYTIKDLVAEIQQQERNLVVAKERVIKLQSELNALTEEMERRKQQL